MDAREKDSGRWLDMLVYPFVQKDTPTLPVGGGLLVPCSLPGPPGHKTTRANGDCGAWPGWAVSVSVVPLA